MIGVEQNSVGNDVRSVNIPDVAGIACSRCFFWTKTLFSLLNINATLSLDLFDANHEGEKTRTNNRSTRLMKVTCVTGVGLGWIDALW